MDRPVPHNPDPTKLLPFDSKRYEEGELAYGYPELHKRARDKGARSTVDDALAADDAKKTPDSQ